MKENTFYIKRIPLLLGILLIFLFTITGCGQLKSEKEVEKELEQLFPEMTILNIEEGTRDGEYDYKTYTIDHKGIQFTYENYQTADAMFGVTVANSHNDYQEMLFTYFAEEIENIKEIYQVEIDERCNLRKDITSMNQIESCVKAFQEIYLLMEDYLPESRWNSFSFALELTVFYGKADYFSIYKQGDFDYDYVLQYFYLNFKDALETGQVKEVTYSQELLSRIPQKYIRHLYINGESYQSERYEICFLYNIEDGNYYTPVGFGIELEYNGGVEDYLQREIIETYYPDSEYTISDKRKTSTYKIGDNEYSVKRNEDGLVFRKNKKSLTIPNYDQIQGIYPGGASYFYWVSVDDFASLMEMSVEKVQADGVYLRLP